ncbi:MAG: tetratricopeptide repeat protein [Cyclobacteriaceae bacterium]|nr:tetratricopeptide repeat protein [Cyclobacteriaceae bacterium HetDA_MAG_MS6]
MITCLVFWMPLLTYSSAFDEIQKDTDDSVKLQVNNLAELARSHRGKHYDSAFMYARQGLRLAVEAENDSLVMNMKNLIGIFHFFQSSYDSAVRYYHDAYQVALQISDSTQLGAVLSNTGMVMNYQAKYDTALNLLFRSLTIREQINDPKTSSSLNNIGLVYQRIGNLNKSLHYLKRAAVLKEKKPTVSLSNTYNNIGIAYKELKQYDSGIYFYRKALDVALQFDDWGKSANAYNNLAVLYEILEKLDTARVYYLKSIDLKQKVGNRTGLFNSYINYAYLLRKEGKYQQALASLAKADKIQEEIGKTMHTFSSLKAKAEVLKALGRDREALDVFAKAWETRYEEINEEKGQKTAELEVAYETQKKEAEIQRLSLETDLQKATIRNSYLTIISLAVVMGLVSALLIVFFRSRLRQQRLEKKAQELQIEALEKRFIELHSTPAQLELDFQDLNEKLNTPLTDREFEALKLSLNGHTNPEIAEKLFVSVSTVKFHLRNTYSKLGVGNRKEAFQYLVKTN